MIFSLTCQAANYAAFAFGFSQGSIFLIYALAFYFGAKLIVWGTNTPLEILSALFAVIFTAMYSSFLTS
jgi:hypothetical protein